MSRFPQLNEFAEDIGWHMIGFAQGLFDVATVTVLALAIYASEVEMRPVATVQASTAVQGPGVCMVNCISAQVLKRRDS